MNLSLRSKWTSFRCPCTGPIQSDDGGIWCAGSVFNACCTEGQVSLSYGHDESLFQAPELSPQWSHDGSRWSARRSCNHAAWSNQILVLEAETKHLSLVSWENFSKHSMVRSCDRDSHLHTHQDSVSWRLVSAYTTCRFDNVVTSVAFMWRRLPPFGKGHVPLRVGKRV